MPNQTVNAISIITATSLLIIFSFGRVEAASPVELATFNFNDTSTNAKLLSKTSGPVSAALTTNFTNSSDITNFTGSSVNAQGTDPSGQALALLGGSGNVENGKFVTLQATTTGYSGLQLSFATQKTSTGFNSNQLQYSTDNVTYNNLGNPYVPSTSFGLQKFDLSSVTTLNNQPNVYLRIVFNGSSGTSQNNRIDNLSLQSVTPAPPGVVSAGIGFGVTGISALLRRRKQTRATKSAEVSA